jgi:predicted nucleotidyltransferase
MAEVDAAVRTRCRKALQVVARQAPITAAFLFGSYAEGRVDRWSDIDLAVFVEGAEEWDIVRRAKSCAQVQKEVGDDFELHFLPARAMRSPAPASFAAFILKRGIPVAWD